MVKSFHSRLFSAPSLAERCPRLRRRPLPKSVISENVIRIFIFFFFCVIYRDNGRSMFVASYNKYDNTYFKHVLRKKARNFLEARPIGFLSFQTHRFPPRQEAWRSCGDRRSRVLSRSFAEFAGDLGGDSGVVLHQGCICKKKTRGYFSIQASHRRVLPSHSLASRDLPLVISLSSLRMKGVTRFPVTFMLLAFLSASDIADSTTAGINACSPGMGTANSIPVLIPSARCDSRIAAASSALETLHGAWILSNVSVQ